MSMRSESTGSKAIVLMFCVLLIMGSVSVFLVFEAMNAKNPDPYMTVREYVFEGEMYGEACTGDGTISNKPENNNYHLYSLDYTLRTSDREETYQFGILFGLDDRPDQSLYEYVGTITIEDKELSVWKGDKSGMVYTMYIGDRCAVEKLLIESDNHYAEGHLKG